MNSYVKTPDVISYQDVINKDYTLSSSQFIKLNMKNSNYLYVEDFLNRKLTNADLGSEVGSLSYIDKSTHYFLRTKALQDYTYIPEITSESMLPILPSEFINMNLKKNDIIISKDSNIGEIAILDKDYPNTMLSGAIYKLPVKEEWRFYLLSCIKHQLFREQLDSLVPKGATIRHAKTLFLKCKIPLPEKNSEDIIKYISFLTEAVVNKETLIKQRYETILKEIENELINNQSQKKFSYSLPTYTDIIEFSRLDTSLYDEYFQKEIFKIQNYKNGSHNIYELGFVLSRGQNLQISNIGDSIYSEVKHKNFYTLMLPKFLSRYGTIQTVEYLGNKNELKTLKYGDLIFGAEGFEKGRSIVVLENNDRVITNIHGITIQQKEYNITKSIFIKEFLDYLRSKKLIDMYAVGGNGGSLAQKYWNIIPFPAFDETKEKELVKLYHNPDALYDGSSLNLDNFREKDHSFNEIAGIYELDKTVKHFKSLINSAIDKIANSETVEIIF